MARWICTVCGYVYEDKEERSFDDLPDDWVCCSVCGAGKNAFERE